jgi:hypothetical protein
MKNMPVILTGMSTTTPDDRFTTYSPVVATTEFAADFEIYDVADLTVFIDGVKQTDLTVSATFENGVSTNARAIFLPDGVVGDVVVVGSRSPRRSNKFVNGAPLPIDKLNLALDTVEAEMQEASRDVDRAHKAPFGQPGGVFTIDDIMNAEAYAERAGQEADRAEAAADSASDYADFARNNWVVNGPFIGTGAQADYPLTIDPGSANNMFLVVGGIAQLSTQGAYSLIYSGGNPFIRTNVFAGVPFEVRISNAINIGTPSDGTVTTPKIGDGAATTAKIADDAVTYAKMQNIAATLRLLGRKSAGAGDPEEISAGELRDLFLPAGAMIDSASAVYTANADITAVIPNDDTIPQITEGTQILQVSISPKSTTNKLRIRYSGFGGVNGVAPWSAALFNGGANAIHSAAFVTPVANYYDAFAGEVEYTPGTTAAQTISLRVGPSGAQTLRLNGLPTARLYGGTAGVRLVVEEIKA